MARHDPSALLKLCAARFVAGGYHLTGQGPGWISAAKVGGGCEFHTTGKTHTLTVSCDGHAVTFIAQAGFGCAFTFNDVPFFNEAVGSTLMACDSWMVQHAVMNDAPQSQRHPPQSTHVVERQVVVTRCKFCRAHTPIDLPACQGCGAASFS